MASQSERAHTCKLPFRKGPPFLRLNCPDWSKLDIIGQTIIFVELTRHFGSFQNACAALKLHSNEVESFVSTHLQYQQASERGRLMAEQWARDQAVPADDNEDIPPFRPVLIFPSSIAPACDFLQVMGYHDHIQAVRAWSRRTITWPPYIDVTDLDTSTLDQSDINFPEPRRQRAYSRYFGSLGNDSRAIVGFVGVWRPKEDGSPDTRISFINVPAGSVAFGPRGSRQLVNPGRYSICWRTSSLSDNTYNDFVLARNTFDDSEGGNDWPNPPDSGGSQDENGGRKAERENWNVDEEPDTTLPTGLTVNPKAIFGTPMPDADNFKNRSSGPFHSQDEPQGPSRDLENPQLQQTWSSWPGQIFQFRLPRDYTVLGPLGHVLTFDPPKYEKYDEMGNPHGVGGTYFIVPFQDTQRAMCFTMEDLPIDVSIRFKFTERLVLIRNGMVLPRFVEPGVHEWSTRDGMLEFYNAHGCYDVMHTEGRDNILLESGRDQLARNEEHMEHGRNVAGHSSPIREAIETLAPHRDWLYRQEAKSTRLEQEIEGRARLDARNAREKARRDILIEERESRQQALEVREAQEQARVDAAVREDTAISQGVKNRRGRRKQNSNGRFDPNPSNLPPASSYLGDTQQHNQQSIDPTAITAPDITAEEKVTPRRGRPAGATRRKRADDDEDEAFTPTRSRPARGRNPRSAQRTPTPKMSQEQPANDVSDVGNPQSTSVLGKRRTRAATSQVQPENSGSGSASARMDQSSGALTATKPRRTVPERKPIGPLLEAIRADPIIEGGRGTALHFSTVPGVNRRETAPGAVNDSGAIGRNTMGLRPIAMKRTSVPQEPFGCDEDEFEDEMDQ
ncbi:hypothetical protein F4859DRAFT_46727 [Xylaria cf. heliscus]|nr:hypothetical protein F4859DRAFT_46727 [Xylaria cf. heliscus]